MCCVACGRVVREEGKVVLLCGECSIVQCAAAARSSGNARRRAHARVLCLRCFAVCRISSHHWSMMLLSTSS
jgi:hypothetical protein